MLSVSDIEERLMLSPTADHTFEAVLVLSVERNVQGIFRTMDDGWKERVAHEAAMALWAHLYGSVVEDFGRVMESATSGSVEGTAEGFRAVITKLMEAAGVKRIPGKEVH